MIAVVLLGGFGFVARKNHERKVVSSPVLSTPPLANLTPEFIDILSLGHRGLYDDFIEIWLAQIFANKKILDEPPEKIRGFLEHVFRLLPKTEMIYLLSSSFLELRMQRPSYAIPILKKGMEALPDSWRISASLGYIYAFRLNDRGQGAPYMYYAAGRPGAPAFLKSFSMKLASDSPISREEFERALQFIIEISPGKQHIYRQIFQQEKSP